MHTIHYKDIISNAWSLFKERWGFLWGLLLIVFVLSGINSGINSTFYGEEGKLETSFMIVLVYTLISMVIGIILKVGLINIFLGLVRGAEVKFKQLIGDMKLIVPYFLGSLLYGLVVTVGFLLLIVPGIIWSLKYSQTLYLIVDKRMGVMDAFKKSGELTYGSKVDLFVLWLVFMLLIVVSAIPLGLGLIATIPMGLLLPALVYTRLLQTKDSVPAPEAPAPEDYQQVEENPATELEGEMQQ